jgi:hypothetical protein
MAVVGVIFIIAGLIGFCYGVVYVLVRYTNLFIDKIDMSPYRAYLDGMKKAYYKRKS